MQSHVIHTRGTETLRISIVFSLSLCLPLTSMDFFKQLYETFNMLDNLVSGRKKGTFVRINFCRAYLCPRFFLRYYDITEAVMARNAANGTIEGENTQSLSIANHQILDKKTGSGRARKKKARNTSSRQVTQC